MSLKNRVFFCVFFFGPLFLPAAQAPGGQVVFPQLEPDAKAAGYALMGEDGYSWQELAEMSLWASGADPSAAAGKGKPSYMEVIGGGVEELRNDPALPKDPRELGDYLLRFAHRKFLKRYSLNQTRVDLILSGGQFNCVSSAALYSIFAVACGLQAEAAATKDHAFVTVRIGDEIIDVETTNPYGFDPGNKKEFHDQFGQVTGFAYTPVKNYRDRTAINLTELVSIIFSNRITDLETKGRYAEAIPLAINRMVLLSGPFNKASSDFFSSGAKAALDRIFNYGASLLRAGKEEQALQWADLAGARYADPARWQEFRFAALNNLTGKLLKARRFSEAGDLLRAYEPVLDAEEYRQLAVMAADNEIAFLANNIKTLEDADAVLARIGGAEEKSLLAGARLQELRAFVLVKKMEFLLKENDFSTALSFMEEAIAAYGTNSLLESNLKVLHHNRVVNFHNSFAAAYNRRNFEEAIRIAQEALEEYPGHSQLQADLEMAKKAVR